MEIQEIKSRLSITTVLAHYGLQADKNHKMCCPFHSDKTPSMQVYPSTNTVYCFSSNCKIHGRSLDVIDFIKEKENITKHEAILKAKQLCTLSVSEIPPLGGKAIKKAQALTGETLPTITPTKPMDELTRTAVLTKMYAYFRNGLKSSKPAREYIEQRNLRYEALDMGFNSGQYHHGERRDEALIKSCLEVGLLTEYGSNTRTGGQGYRVFGKDCITFALRNKENNITGLYFRSIVNNDKEKHYYLKDSSGLYPSYPKETTEKLILTEAIIDGATILQHQQISDEYSILSAYGTNRLTQEHIKAITALPNLKEIIFAFDGDESAKKSIHGYFKQTGEWKRGYGEILQELLPEVKLTTINLPEGEDLNSLSQSHEQDIFIHLLENRTPVLLNQSKEGDKSLLIEGNTVPLLEEAPKATSEDPILNTRNPFKITYKTDTATYYVQGGVSKNLDSMKITLVIENEDGYKSRNKLDLYEDKQVEKLCKDVSERLQLRRDLLEQDVYKLTDLLDRYRDEELKQSQSEKEADIIVPLTEKQKQQLESFATKPQLIKRLNELLGKTGIVGEEQNRIFLLLVAISHKMDSPSHALIQGSSGSGKTKLLKQIVSCMPREKVTLLTRMTDKALYNYQWNYFNNRLFCLEDMDGLSEEAEFALRELMSSGSIRSSAAIKDEQGNISTGEKYVEGPIASLACTTKGEIYEDNMGRVFLIAVDESLEQTKRIIEYQNKKAAGLIDQEQEKQASLFMERFVRSLTPYQVVNPYANQIHLPEEAHKIRRLNDLFQSFVKIITMVNQYQRKKDSKQRLISELEDLELAVEMMFECIVLKVDELDGSLRQFYEKLKHYLKKEYKENFTKIDFTGRQIRQALQLSKAQVNRYLQTLLELEYIQQSGFLNKGFKYKIMYWDNYEAIRNRIKDNLQQQIEGLKQP
jgi:DNA primase